MVYNVFIDLGMFFFITASIVAGYKLVTPYIRVEAYKAGYYVGRLRQHADKNKVDLDKETANVLRSDWNLLKKLDPEIKVKTYVEETDELFNEKKK
jgi:hypothetical protein